MRAWTTLTALALSAFLFVTTETLPVGLLPQIAADLHVGTPAVGFLVTAYGLVVVLATVPLTRLTQRWPRRRLLGTLLLVFAVTTALSALAPSYPALIAFRVAAALSQAVFWATVLPATAALVRPALRGRAIAVLYAGSSAAPLLGVPGGTWLGQQTNWRTAFLILAALGVATLAVIAAAMPNAPANGSDTTRGSAPDAGRYRVLTITTALTVTGAFTAFTYLTPFLTDVSGIPPDAIGPLLLIRGAAGLLGALLGGLLRTRALPALVATQAIALFAQHTWATTPAAATAATSAAALSLSALSTVLAVRVLEVAPGHTNLASAGISTAFNIGITAGALFGGLLVPGPGLRAAALAGALITLAALATALSEPHFATAHTARTSQAAVQTRDDQPNRTQHRDGQASHSQHRDDQPSHTPHRDDRSSHTRTATASRATTSTATTDRATAHFAADHQTPPGKPVAANITALPTPRPH